MKRWLVVALALGACSKGGDPVDAGAPQGSEVLDGVEFSAETRVMESFPVQLQPVLTLRNTGADSAEVVFTDGCTGLLQVYRTAERTGEPAWDQARVTGCTKALVPVELAAGESRQLRGRTVSAAEILGDSLPPGTYYFSIGARLVEPGRISIPAGSADLAK